MTVKARFVPKDQSTLRPELDRLIGQEFAFDYSGWGADDEPFPGQHRWIFAREHDEELGPELAGLWSPEEDLDPRPAPPSWA